jgi:hypothetical protein
VPFKPVFVVTFATVTRVPGWNAVVNVPVKVIVKFGLVPVVVAVPVML